MNNNAIEQFINAVKEPEYETNTTYSAVVSRVDSEGVVWVNLAGSEKETPTASTSADVKAGDVVTVQWRNNKLYIAGNYSDPSAGVIRVANVEAAANTAREAANNAVADAGRARDAAEQAEATAAGVESIAVAAEQAAQNAQNSLKSVVQGATTVEKAVSVMQTALEAVVDYDPATDTTKEYFWHDANGAHVLGDDSGYRNDITSAGMKIMDVTSEESVAEFSASGAQIGKSDGAHTIIDEDGMQIYSVDANDNLVELANIGYGQTYGDASAVMAPYYSFGNRLSTANVYDASSTYKKGAVCLYNGKLYVCINDIDTPQAFTPSNWRIDKGSRSIAEGARVVACGAASHAEGVESIASHVASHAEGWGAKALGDQSHAEGLQTNAVGQDAHAEGAYTKATGYFSHAEGIDTEASGSGSHAEGNTTYAGAQYSHAQNYNTRATKKAQTVLGTYNREDISQTTTHPSGDNSYGKYAVILGNGVAGSRSDALTVDWDGNVADGNGYQFIKCISGSSGNWTYKKYSDGTFDAWYSGSLTYTNDGQLSSYNPTWYRSHISVTLPSAIGTVSVKTYNFSLSSNATFTMMGYSTASGSTLTQYVVRGGGSLASATNVTCYVHGTWS